MKVFHLPNNKTLEPESGDTFAAYRNGKVVRVSVDPLLGGGLGGPLALVAYSGSYLDLLNKPSLGTAASKNSTEFATAAQGTNADTAHSWGNHADAGYVKTNTTYSTGTLAQLDAGTDTTGRLQTAKNLNDWLVNKGYVTTDTTYTASTGLNLSGTAFSVKYGTAAGTAAQGNDSRIINGQTAHSWGNHASAGYAVASSVNTALSAKVDKVAGKDLSTNDFTNADKGKLDGVELGATKNATDAQLRGRATHTGVQPISTVSGLQTALDGKVDNTDSRLTNSREWTGATASQAEAEAGVATTRRAWTAQRVRQAIQAWFLTVSGTVGRTILGRSTAAEVRSDLGLGTASTRNVGESSGNLMEVGAFGVGASGGTTATPTSDVKSTGIYRGTSSDPRNIFGSMGFNYLNIVHTSDYIIQLAMSGNNSRAAIRSFNTDYEATTPFQELYHTGNILTSTGQSTLYPMTQKAVTDALTTKANTSTQVISGNGLTGGGTLASNRTLSVKYGTTAGTAAQGNDARLSNSREWTASTVSQAEAEAGTATTRRAWTAQRVRQAIQAWFLSTSGTVGRNILGRSTAAEVRNDLELGSASTKNVGTGRGNVMEVGAFGVGYPVVLGGTSLDSLTNSGQYYQTSSALASLENGFPINTSGSLLAIMPSSVVGTQLFTSANQNRVFVRTSTNNNWGEWREFFHTGNFNPSNYYTKSQTDSLVAGATTGSNVWQNATTALIKNAYNKVAFPNPKTLTLPSNPTENDYVAIITASGNMQGSKIARNGKTIMGLAEDMEINMLVTYLRLDYVNGSWRIAS